MAHETGRVLKATVSIIFLPQHVMGEKMLLASNVAANWVASHLLTKLLREFCGVILVTCKPHE